VSTTPSDDAKKYILVYYLPEDKDPESPPFKYRTFYLADALEGAWRNQQAGGRALSITQADRVVFSSEELSEALGRVQQLLSLAPERSLREITERIIDETGKD
jgi:hypothetical protein